MKAILLATAMTLAMGSAAIAQDTTAPATPAAPTTTPGAPDSTDSSGAAPAAPAPADGTAAPAPADAASAPATPDASATPAAATTDYPACSKSVTDKCIEKGGAHAHKAKKKR